MKSAVIKPPTTQFATSTCTTEQIMSHPDFERGLMDIRSGRPFDDRADDEFWAYERGRLFGAIAPLTMRLWVGRRLNPNAVTLYNAAYRRKLIG